MAKRQLPEERNEQVPALIGGRLAICALILWAFVQPVPAAAQPKETSVIASELARLVAFEETCTLQISRSGMAAFIRQNVAPDDLSFNSLFNFLVDVRRRDLDRLPEASKSIQCAQLEAIGTHFGLLDGDQ